MERLDDGLIGGQNINISANLSTQTSNGGGAGSGSGGGGGSGGSGNELASQSSLQRPAYTIPGILHYLQHEWTRFEYERQQWETEKSELLAKISFLQGERRGQENLKNDLIRRIKMLELALKQERIKYAKIKYGCSDDIKIQSSEKVGQQQQQGGTNQNDQQQQQQNENDYDSLNYTNLLNQHDQQAAAAAAAAAQNQQQSNNNQYKHGRQLLRQYLQEIGYTETIIDIRSNRLRTLLNGQQQQQQQNGGGPNMQQSSDMAEQLLKENQNYLNINTDTMRKLLLNEQKKLLLNNKQQQQQQQAIEQHQQYIDTNSGSGGLLNSNNSNNNGNVLNEMNDEIILNDEQQQPQQQQQFNGIQLSTDSETEDALKEFSFLTNEPSNVDDWNIDKATIQKLTEEYKKDRKSKLNKSNQQQQQQQASQQSTSFSRPNRATLQAMIANLNEQQQQQQQQQPQIDSTQSSNSIQTQQQQQQQQTQQQQQIDIDQVNSSSGQSSSSKNLSFLDDNQLGELSHISVNNNDDTVIELRGIDTTNELNSSTSASSLNSRRTLTNKYILRGHFDSIRCLTFHPTESLLITGSEDQTIKLWNLDKFSNTTQKKNVNTSNDIEPVYTYRGHTGAVLSCLVSSNGKQLLTSSLDSSIRLWNIPNDDCDPYDTYDSSIFVKTFYGHTDAVWGICLLNNDQTLVSISADSTIRAWSQPLTSSNGETSNGYTDHVQSTIINKSNDEGIPTCINTIDLNEPSKVICSFDTLHHSLYDIEYSKCIQTFDYSTNDKSSFCYKVISNPSNSLIISAHEDKRIRFYDVNSAKLVHSMVAHQDAITDLDIDPNSLYLLSSSHDCSLRLWNIDNKNCVQELTAHRKKNDESINCIAFHKTKLFIASGAADAIAKVYV